MGNPTDETHWVFSLVRAALRKLKAGLGGAAVALAVCFVSSFVGGMLEGPLNTTIVRWEFGPVAVMLFSVAGGFVAGILATFSRRLIYAALTGAVSVGSFLTWICLKSGAPTGVIVWGIAVGVFAGIASGLIGYWSN